MYYTKQISVVTTMCASMRMDYVKIEHKKHNSEK
jgi:hypothetical protein